MSGKGKTSVRRFVADQSGAATVEAVLWLPFIIAFFCLIVDTTMIFHNRTQALRVIQDANRGVVMGRFSPAEAMDYVRARITPVSPTALVQTTVSMGVVKTELYIPARDLDATGLITPFLDIVVGVQAEHMTET